VTHWASDGQIDRFRHNEMLRASAASLTGPFAFSCECSRRHCDGLVVIEAADMDRIRANSRRLILATGHQTDQHTIVLTAERGAVVES
jgi:hypothetical protein